MPLLGRRRCTWTMKLALAGEALARTPHPDTNAIPEREAPEM